MKSHRKMKRALYAALIVLIVLSIIPYETTAIRAYKLRVIDEDGNPVGGTAIEQKWGGHLIIGEHRQTLTTDEAGYVTFPARTINLGLLPRVMLTLIKIPMELLTFGHERRGTYMFINAGSTGFGGFYENESPPSELVLKRGKK